MFRDVNPQQDQLQTLFSLMSAGQFGQALARSEKLRKKFPHSSSLLHIIATCYINMKRFDDAAVNLKKLLDVSANDPQIMQQLANVEKVRGNLPAAVSWYSKTLKIEPNNLKSLYNLGNTLLAMGKHTDAIKSYKRAIAQKPDFFEAHNNLGYVLGKSGQFGEAVRSYKRALEIRPQSSETCNNIGNALRDEGKIEAAINWYEKTIGLKSNHSEAARNLGNIFRKQEKMDMARKWLERAIEFQPDSSAAHNDIGVLLMDVGEQNEALAHFKRALDVAPNNAVALNNLGNITKDAGELETALTYFERALATKPDLAESYFNIAKVYVLLKKHESAIQNFHAACRFRPDYLEAQIGVANCQYAMGQFGEAITSISRVLGDGHFREDAFDLLARVLQEVKFLKPDPGLLPLLERLILVGHYARPRNIERAILSLLRQEPDIIDLLDKEASALDGRTTLKTLAKYPVLLRLMEICPITDIDFETIFQRLRFYLAQNRSELTDVRDALEFSSSLALYFFTNEYVCHESAAETEIVRWLEESIDAVLGEGRHPSDMDFLILACYRPLHNYRWCRNVSATEKLRKVVERTINEPLLEREIAAGIKRLGRISDRVSNLVREQYEENPYPRWVVTSINRPSILSQVFDDIGLKLASTEIGEVTHPEILIAGCGTGQHALSVASRFKNCQVTAIDLSVASLAYAKRKTDELGLKNISYLQADILELHQLKQTFDIIESVGVLHHLSEPMTGWSILVDCLRPGGLFKVGLYSERARGDVVKIRREIEGMAETLTEANMRTYRHEIMTSSSKHHLSIRRSSDFYSMSSIRDLLFNVQEHRYTIPQIKQCLDETNLNFCGFEAKQGIIQDFIRNHSDEAALYDLDEWNRYEENNPTSFAGMYQFWCQKPR